jgi:hypothetical protein
VGNPRKDMPKGLPFNLTDYLELVDWTGRILREDKRGSISQDLPPILERLQIDPQHWRYLTQHFESPFKGLVGAAYALKQACQNLGYQRSPGEKSGFVRMAVLFDLSESTFIRRNGHSLDRSGSFR